MDSFIYFANIRPDYNWCYFNRTVCYQEAIASGGGGGDEVDTVTFWDTNSNQCYAKQIDALMSMAASVDHCVLAVETRMTGKEFSIVAEGKGKELMYQLLVCNSISTTVDCECWWHEDCLS